MMFLQREHLTLVISEFGEQISLGKCVWGHTFPGGTHITVTPDFVSQLCSDYSPKLRDKIRNGKPGFEAMFEC